MQEYKINRTAFDGHPGYRRGVIVVRDAANTSVGSNLQSRLRVVARTTSRAARATMAVRR